MPEFLLEIGLEEVPARMIAAAEAELLRRVAALLERERLLTAGTTLLSESVRSYSTPRRLAVTLSEVLPAQPDLTEEVTGPAFKIAFKDGLPTPAAEAFARKTGVPVTELKSIETPKGVYLAATRVKKGRTAGEVLATELPKEIGAIYWAKNMYWRAGKPERFVRPVLWLVCLLGDDVVPLEFAGKVAGRATYGHRVLSSDEPFEIVSPSSYAAQLEGEYVLADVEARRYRIRKALDRSTREVSGARWREDEALVDAVTHLTEWPEVLLGSFESTFLQLPEEVLVTVMRDHQKYFAVEGPDGKLLPHFLTVLNISTDERSAPVIRQGNERVLRARFNDARFFWEFDQRTPLGDRMKLLENVTFQKDLGSYAAKTERMWKVAQTLMNLCDREKPFAGFNQVKDAVYLAKTDLTTELVKEFTELQGIIGGLYAKAQGINSVAAEATYDQYLPASAKDRIPRSPEGAILGLADRMDTLAGLFRLGMEPTGSKDPFALRRAANAVVRILAESGLPLTLSNVIGAVTHGEPNKQELEARLNVFFSERVEFYLREVRGNAYDVVKAVMVIGGEGDLRDLVARAEAVSSMRGSADFEAVSAALKRMTKILEQAVDRGEELGAGVSEAMLQQPEERMLFAEARQVLDQVETLQTQGQYRQALETMATIRGKVDAFFDAVMVMAPEAELRTNRLALLSSMVRGFSGIADFSEIVVAG